MAAGVPFDRFSAVRDFLNAPKISLRHVHSIVDTQNQASGYHDSQVSSSLAGPAVTTYGQRRHQRGGQASSTITESYAQAMHSLYGAPPQPQYLTNRSAMYHRHARKVVTTIGADRAAKLSYDLTRHRTRLKAAAENHDMNEFVDDDGMQDGQGGGRADHTGAGVISSEGPSDRDRRHAAASIGAAGYPSA